MKYYTPTIEEFHVGFRYELVKQNEAHYYPDPPSKWHRFSHNIKSISFSKLDMEVRMDRVRVKYLDQQDIEELGWEWAPDGKLAYGDWMDVYYLHKGQETYRLTYINEKRSVRIVHKESVDTSSVLFFGKVKNFNELEKIMKMLEI